MKILSTILLLLLTYTLSFGGSSALRDLRKSERTATLKDFKVQMKSRLSNTGSRSTSRHRSSSISHNNRFVHQSTQEMKQLSTASSNIQNSAVNVKDHYEKVYHALEEKYYGNEQEISDEIHKYRPFEDSKDDSDDDELDDFIPDDLDEDIIHMPQRSLIWGRR